VWKTDVADGAIETQPIPSLDESAIYVATLGLTGASGHLVALDRKDGAVKFRVALGARSYATPCVDANGNVYSASDAKKFFAVRPDGAIAWTLDLDDEGDTACAIASDGTIVFAAGKTLYDVRANGDVVWRFSAHGKIFTAPAIDARGRVIVGSQDHHAYAVERGEKSWAVDLGADVDGSPAIDDDGASVVGTDAGDVVKLDENGGVIFSASLGGFVRGPLSIARGGDVIVGVYGPRSRVVRLDGKNGKEKASFDVAGTGALEFGVHGGPLEDAEGKLYFGAQDDRLYAFAPLSRSKDGRPEPIFALQTGGDVDAPPTLLTNGALVVASDDGVVYYLNSQEQ
jgi:outer membrane protein assembly factor BamB